ncbi:MAG: hypothetical protein Q4F38_09875 [Akkermansia sp.]|nr:hypothetical protein [Akkermansia sp.]
MMKLTPRRKYLLAGVALVYLLGLAVDIRRNYCFCPTPGQIERALAAQCHTYRLPREGLCPVGEALITRRIFSDSDWYCRYRQQDGTAELELIIDSSGDVYSNLLPQKGNPEPWK